MPSPLLNCFIFICKLVTCFLVFIALNTHHWIRKTDGSYQQGMRLQCYDYGGSCYKSPRYFERGIWFFYIITLLNVTFDLLNILLLCKRTRSPINLILEELAVLTTIVFILPAGLISIALLVFIRYQADEQLDWSSIIFLLSVVLALVDLICSLVRVVSYCRDNSFRSNVIRYTSNNNHETIHIQS